MKIKFFKKETSFKKENFQFSPEFFWRIAVIIAFFVILLSFYFGINLFMQTNQEPVVPTISSSGQVPTVDIKRMTKVLDYFSQRAQKSADILNSSAPVVDPSL